MTKKEVLTTGLIFSLVLSGIFWTGCIKKDVQPVKPNNVKITQTKEEIIPITENKIADWSEGILVEFPAYNGNGSVIVDRIDEGNYYLTVVDYMPADYDNYVQILSNSNLTEIISQNGDIKIYENPSTKSQIQLDKTEGKFKINVKSNK